MSYLHFFMILLFFIGMLLVIMSFFAYSKIKDTCKSEGLKSKLNIGIGIGSALMAMSIGFFICVNRCKCTFNDNLDQWKINGLVSFSLLSGIGLLALTFGIKSDLDNPECNVDLGAIVWLLGLIASIQLVCSVIYIVIIIKKHVPDTVIKVNSVDKKNLKEEIGDEEKSAQYDAENEASRLVQRRMLTTQIKEKELALTKTNEIILKTRHSKKDPKAEDLTKVQKLKKDIDSSKRELQELNSSSQSSLSSGLGSSLSSGLGSSSLSSGR
jgi:hypothetical protein